MAIAADGYAANDAFAVVLVADGPSGTDATTAVGLLGGRIATRIGWATLRLGLDTALPRPIIVAEADATDRDLVDGLAVLADLADRGTPVIVAMEEARIDIVAAQLFGGSVQALCQPTIADRVAALVVAAERRAPAVLHDPWRESDGARLQRLHQEVARIADVLARLSRDEAPGTDLADRRGGYDSGPGSDPAPDPLAIRRLIRARQVRAQFFSPGLFEDPAWDMLLDLYAAELEGARVSVSSLCIAAAVAPTTALRWIAKLTGTGLFVRHPDKHDRRRAFMTLSPTASAAMRGYMAARRRIEAATT